MHVPQPTKTLAALGLAALGVALTAAPMPPQQPPVVFRADRPFFIVLRHKETNTILFIGRVTTV